MKKPLTFVVLAAFVFLLCSFLVKTGQAGYISVGTYSPTGAHKDYFLPGDNVRIIADSSDMPITINVTDPDGILVYTETYYGYVYNKTLSGLIEKLGKYTVEASSPWDAEQKNYARTYFVVVIAVGGKAAPMSKVIIEPELQIPWVWLSTIILPLVLVAVYAKKRKRNTEINP